MALLAGTMYDPAGAVTQATSAALAMTALDTTNLRLVFTVPANGSVLVRLQGSVSGATTHPGIQLGVLQGATVKGRVHPLGGTVSSNLATDFMPVEAWFVVSGLTAGSSLTWDAAYGVEITAASSALKYGGPNDTTGNDAWGGFAFEIYDTVPLLASALYDPGTAATQSGSALLAMTALDSTNLRLTFNAPTSGKVYWRVRVPWVRGASVWGQILLGVLDNGGTVKARVAPQRGLPQVGSSTATAMAEGAGVITGLTPGQSLTYDAAYAVQVVNGGTAAITYGGPNDASSNNAWGAAMFEIWAV